MRLIRKQRHKMSCGPVALANAMKALGLRCSYTEALRKCRRQTRISDGMKSLFLVKALRAQGLEVLVTRRLSFARAERLSHDPDMAIVILYKWQTATKIGWHYALLRDGKSYNTARRSRINPQRWRDTREILKRNPTVYLIRRKT